MRHLAVSTIVFVVTLVAYSPAVSLAQLPAGKGEVFSFDYMDPRNFSLRDYRELFQHGATPTNSELHGQWRGVNKGIVTLFGYRQFIKEIQPVGTCTFGDNIEVHQVSTEVLRCMGWRPKVKDTGELQRVGKYAVQPPKGIGIFRHGRHLSYWNGGNAKTDPSKLLVDKVVKLDDNHMLGRVTGLTLVGPVPLAYFVLERIH